MPTFRCWAVAEGKATEQPIDTSSVAGKAFLDMLGVFAEFETNLRSERQMEGIAAAKLRGVYKGPSARISSRMALSDRPWAFRATISRIASCSASCARRKCRYAALAFPEHHRGTVSYHGGVAH